MNNKREERDLIQDLLNFVRPSDRAEFKSIYKQLNKDLIELAEEGEEEKGLRALQYQEYEKQLKTKDKRIEILEREFLPEEIETWFSTSNGIEALKAKDKEIEELKSEIQKWKLEAMKD